jgi:cytochrome P450
LKLFRILDGFAKLNNEFDLQDIFYRFTLDSFGYIGFRYNVNSLEQRAPFADAFDRMQMKITLRMYNPIWYITELLPWTYFQKRSDLGTLDSSIRAMIRARKAESVEVRKSKPDLLSLFIDCKNESGEFYSDDDLVSHVLNFIIAGRDTTAIALSWAIYFLSQNPKCMADLIEEIDSAVTPAKALDYETVRGLKYANAVFQETLRLAPSVPKSLKFAIDDDVLPSGIKVPSGAGVALPQYSMARNPYVWGPDAENFKPERWLSKNPTQYEHTAFNCGPRICLGKTFAELEGVFVLVSVLSKYKFEVLEPQNVTYSESLTLNMRHGLKCKVYARSK